MLASSRNPLAKMQADFFGFSAITWAESVLAYKAGLVCDPKI
jgi:hypothetical protein